MLYIGTDYKGQEVRGHEMWADLSGAWIREETAYGYTETKVDPEAFVDFYESKGWTIGQNKMKDWKAAVRTWEKRDIFSGSSKKEVNTGLPDWYDYKPNTPPSPEQLEKVLARQRELVEAREKKEKEKEAEKRSESDPLWPF